MALTLVGWGARAEGTTTVTPALPAGYTAVDGDLVVVMVSNKLPTTTPNTPTNWTRLVTGSGGGGTAGIDTGPVRATMFWREVSGGSITIPAFTQPSHTNATILAWTVVYRGDNGIDTSALDWAGMSDTSSGTAFGGTFTTPLAGVQPGDQLAVHGVITSDTPRFNGCSVTQSGITFSTFTERLDEIAVDGWDLAACLYTGSVTSGSSATGPAITLTLSAASTGILMVYRIREAAPPSAPVVTAPADDTITVGDTYSDTATATNSPTSWAWTVQSGPDEVGNTISTAAAISWTPDTAGTFVLRATATNAGGSGYDEVTLTVNAAGGAGGYVTPVVRSATSDDVATTDESIVMAKPAGLAVGDYLLACHTADADGSLAAMTAPAGFTELAAQAGNASSNYPYLKIWGKVATSGDVAASTFTFPGDTGSDEAGALVAIEAGTYDPDDPVGTITFTTQARIANQAITAPSITGVEDGLLICVLSADTNNLSQSFPTPPTGMTEVADDGQAYSLIGVFSEVLTADGATGTRTATPSPSSPANGWTAASFVINPKFVPGGGGDTNHGRMFAFL